MKTIGIIDYGMGNLHSVQNALKAIGAPCFISGDSRELDKADSLLLPGVGAFGDAIQTLRATGMDAYIKESAKTRPLLGICLGMQLLLDESEEMGHWEGLGLIHGKVIRLSAGDKDKAYKIPHMGWNSLCKINPCPLTEGMEEGSYVYFVHSYKAQVRDRRDLAAVTDYGEEIAAIIGGGHVFGAQFHPEKSEKIGLGILSRFAAL